MAEIGIPRDAPVPLAEGIWGILRKPFAEGQSRGLHPQSRGASQRPNVSGGVLAVPKAQPDRIRRTIHLGMRLGSEACTYRFAALCICDAKPRAALASSLTRGYGLCPLRGRGESS